MCETAKPLNDDVFLTLVNWFKNEVKRIGNCDTYALVAQRIGHPMHGHKIVAGSSSVTDHSGILLAKAGLVGQAQLHVAQNARSKIGCTVGEYLVLAGLIDDDEMTEFYHQTLKVPRLREEQLQRIARRTIMAIPTDLAAEFRVVPVSLDKENTLTIAMSDPSNQHAIDEISFFTNCYVVRAVATQRQIAWCLAKYYGYVTALGDEVVGQVVPSDGIPDAVVEETTEKYDRSCQRIEVDAKTSASAFPNGTGVALPTESGASESANAAEVYVSDALSTADSAQLPPLAISYADTVPHPTATIERLNRRKAGSNRRSRHSRRTRIGVGRVSTGRFCEVLQAFEHAESREQVVDCLLHFFSERSSRSVFFAVKRGELCAWKSNGPGLSMTTQTLLVDESSVLTSVVQDQKPFHGNALDETTCAFLSTVIGDVPDRICAIPIVVCGRVVGVLYTDGPSAELCDQQALSVASAAGDALERILRAKARANLSR